LSDGAIAGIVIGVIIGFALIASAVYMVFCYQSKGAAYRAPEGDSGIETVRASYASSIASPNK